MDHIYLILKFIRASLALLFILSPHVENFSHVESHFYNFTPTLLSILSSFLLFYFNFFFLSPHFSFLSPHFYFLLLLCCALPRPTATPRQTNPNPRQTNPRPTSNPRQTSDPRDEEPKPNPRPTAPPVTHGMKTHGSTGDPWDEDPRQTHRQPNPTPTDIIFSKWK